MVRYDETGKKIGLFNYLFILFFLSLLSEDILHIGGIEVQMLHNIYLSSLGHI